MSYVVDVVEVSTVGLESSPVAEALAGLRADEARYFSNTYDHVFVTEPAEGGRRAGGFQLSQGMDVPDELSSFTFARQRSKLAGEIRGSYFVVKGDY